MPEAEMMIEWTRGSLSCMDSCAVCGVCRPRRSTMRRGRSGRRSSRMARLRYTSRAARATTLQGPADGVSQDLVGGVLIGWMGAVSVGRLNGCLGVSGVVQRPRRVVPGESSESCVLGVLLLKVRAVAQDDRGQSRRALGTPGRPGKPPLAPVPAGASLALSKPVACPGQVCSRTGGTGSP